MLEKNIRNNNDNNNSRKVSNKEKLVITEGLLTLCAI